MMQERRRVARRAVAYSVQLSQGNLLIDGIAQDFSSLGIKFRAGVSYAEGFCSGDEALELLSDGEVLVRILDNCGNAMVEFPGVIRWTDGELCGIENVSISSTCALAA